MSGAAYDRPCFVANLRELGMSQGAFAERFGLNSTTVYHWGTSDVQPFPSWVPVLVAAWLDNKRLRESTHGL
jgi:hypothetical protein